MNELLAAAPNAQVAHGALGCMVSLNDLADRPPRPLGPDEVIDLGGKRVRNIDTPHVPARLGRARRSTRRPPARCSAATCSPRSGRARRSPATTSSRPPAQAEDMFQATCLTPQTGRSIRDARRPAAGAAGDHARLVVRGRRCGGAARAGRRLRPSPARDGGGRLRLLASTAWRRRSGSSRSGSTWWSSVPASPASAPPGTSRTRCPTCRSRVLEARDAIGGTWDLFRFPGRPVRLRPPDLRVLVQALDPAETRSPTATPSCSYLDDDGRRVRSAASPAVRPPGAPDRVVVGRRVLAGRRRARRHRRTRAPPVLVGDRRHRLLPLRPGSPPRVRRGRPLHAARTSTPRTGRRTSRSTGSAWWSSAAARPPRRSSPRSPTAARHVTMLQRSPSYYLSLPTHDPIADALQRHLSPARAYAWTRRKNQATQALFYRLCRWLPDVMRRVLGARRHAPPARGLRRRPHFTPTYAPVGPTDVRRARWRPLPCRSRRVAPTSSPAPSTRSPSAGSGSPTARRSTPTSSSPPPASRCWRSATCEVVVDGEVLAPGERIVYKSVMLSDVPNLAYVFGYTNASWTLKVDLACAWICRVHRRTCGARARRTRWRPRRSRRCRRGRCSTSRPATSCAPWIAFPDRARACGRCRRATAPMRGGCCAIRSTTACCSSLRSRGQGVATGCLTAATADRDAGELQHAAHRIERSCAAGAEQVHVHARVRLRVRHARGGVVAEAVGHRHHAGTQVGVEAHRCADGGVLVGDLGEVVGTEAEATGVSGWIQSGLSAAPRAFSFSTFWSAEFSMCWVRRVMSLHWSTGSACRPANSSCPRCNVVTRPSGTHSIGALSLSSRDRRAGGDVGEHRDAVTVAQLLDAHADARRGRGRTTSGSGSASEASSATGSSDCGEELGQEPPLLALLRVGLRDLARPLHVRRRPAPPARRC